MQCWRLTGSRRTRQKGMRNFSFGGGGTGMPAFVWSTNHRMWSVVPPFTDSWDVLKAYIMDPSAYVYWSTPRLQDEIAVGAVAYIFRTVDSSGVVACGVVEEAPKALSAATMSLFAFPDRLTPPGWDEAVAPSAWKTGIRIQRTHWDDPLAKRWSPAHGAVSRLTDNDIAAIESNSAGQ